MDALTAILEDARVRSTVFCRAELGSPWAVRTRGTVHAIFHAVVRGSGWVLVDGEAPRAFRSGDLVVLPGGDPHVLSDSPDTPAVQISDLPAVPGDDGLPCVVAGGAGGATSILCGTFELAPEAHAFVLAPLPRLLLLRSDGSSTNRWLDATLRLLVDESGAARPGAEVVVRRLSDVLLVQVVRAWVASGAASGAGWLGGLSDPGVARVLDAIHGDPSRPWTIRELSRRAGMSRSALYDRFVDLVGEPPGSYLTRWRMARAQVLLRRGDAALVEVAEAVGYASAAAFSRAFKRQVGVSPSEWREAS